VPAPQPFSPRRLIDCGNKCHCMQHPFHTLCAGDEYWNSHIGILSQTQLPSRLTSFSYQIAYKWCSGVAYFSTTVQAWIYKRGSFAGAKPWAPPSCFRSFSVNHNAFDGPIRNKMAAQCLLSSIQASRRQ